MTLVQAPCQTINDLAKFGRWAFAAASIAARRHSLVLRWNLILTTVCIPTLNYGIVAKYSIRYQRPMSMCVKASRLEVTLRPFAKPRSLHQPF